MTPDAAALDAAVLAGAVLAGAVLDAAVLAGAVLAAARTTVPDDGRAPVRKAAQKPMTVLGANPTVA